MLATSVVGMWVSAQAQVKSNKNLQVITDGDDGNGYPVAILMDGNLYRVNCKSNDGKQKAKLTKLASNPESSQYELLKKIFLLIDKAVEDKIEE